MNYRKGYMSRLHLRDEKGFTLVEVIVSAVILAIVFGSAALMFSRGKGFSKGQGRKRICVELAQQRLEQYMDPSMTFATLAASIASSPITEPTPTDTIGIGGSPMNGQGGRPDYRGYTRQTTIEYVMDDPAIDGNGDGNGANDDLLLPCNLAQVGCGNFIRVTVTVSTDAANEAYEGLVEPVTVSSVKANVNIAN